MPQPALASPAATAYARPPYPGRSFHWRSAEFCVIDLETTGLDAAVDDGLRNAERERIAKCRLGGRPA
jgi:hypothetical protein